MDEFIRVPGTNFRVGLDPLIGLLPGLGDTSSALISAFALIQAARRGVPKILLARMSFNILVNEIVGTIPIIGDAFSFWFKSNARNYAIIKDHIATPGASRRSDWVFVIGVLITLGVIVCCGFIVTFLVFREIAKCLRSREPRNAKLGIPNLESRNKFEGPNRGKIRNPRPRLAV